MRASKQNFLQAHWDWLVAIAGLTVLGLCAAMFVMAIGESTESATESQTQMLDAVRPSHEGVAAADMSILDRAIRRAKTPPTMSEIDPKKGSFLASERRVVCQKGDLESKKEACGKPIPAGCEVCPLCGMKQVVVKVELDTDHDGMPNDWEKKYGFNSADASDAEKDADGDGFTNIEEYQAQTDPRDEKSHPDYLDFVTVAGGIKQTTLPFYFNDATPIPGGHRFVFKRHGASGYDSKVSVKMNEEIAGTGKNAWKSGWKVTGYEKKSEKRKIAGSSVAKMVDVSTIEVERIADGKKLTAVVNERVVTVESQCEINFNRGEGKKFIVSEGTEFSLYKNKYRVKKLSGNATSCEVTISDLTTKTEKIIKGQ